MIGTKTYVYRTENDIIAPMIKCMLFCTYSVPSDDYLSQIFQRGGFLPNLFSSPALLT
jgi:hypothetical protein